MLFVLHLTAAVLSVGQLRVKTSSAMLTAILLSRESGSTHFLSVLQLVLHI